MNAASSFRVRGEEINYVPGLCASRVEIDLGRVATWTLIFTNTFLVSYFFAKLFQLV